MTIKHKLLGGGLVLSLMVVVLMTVSIFSFSKLGNGFLDIIENSEIGVANSQTTKSNISRVNNDLSLVTKDMLAVADEINHANQNMKLLERKIKQISVSTINFRVSMLPMFGQRLFPQLAEQVKVI